jgi:hypothetical protein
MVQRENLGKMEVGGVNQDRGEIPSTPKNSVSGGHKNSISMAAK